MWKKIMIFFLILTTMCSSIAISKQVKADDVIYIHNKAELQAIGFGGNYELANDIDCSGGDFTPITNFAGSLNGKGFTISNLSLTSSFISGHLYGLFKQITGTASLTNINFDSCNLSVTFTDEGGSQTAGLLVGFVGTGSAVIINNIHATNCTTTIGEGCTVGGLIGTVDPQDLNFTIRNCSYTGSIGTEFDDRDPIGGIVGMGTNIINCYFSGIISVAFDYTNDVGGIVGITNSDAPSDFTISQCSSNISMSITNWYGGGNIGGIVGSTNSPVINCYAVGSISYNNPESALNVTSIGGIIGYSGYPYETSNTTLTNCYSNVGMTFDSTPSVGALIGTIGDTGSVVHSYWNTDIYSGHGVGNYPLYGEGKNTLQMKTQSTFVSWNFVNIWAISSLTNTGYPFLLGFDPLSNSSIFVVLQGGSRPDAGWAIPVTINFFTPGADVMTDTPLFSYSTTTTKSGLTSIASISGQATQNIYDLTVVSSGTLLNVKRNAYVFSDSTINVGTLLEGDANSNGTINIQDFGILQATFNKSAGDSGYDARADFDLNGIVNIQDFGLMEANYQMSSPIEVTPPVS